MRNKRFTRIVAIVLAVLMLLSVGTIVFASLFSAEARVTQEQIDRLRATHREYQRQRREIQAEIDSLEFDHLTETSRKSVLDQRIMLTAGEIESINEIIGYYNVLIREREYDVFLATVREEEQLELYRIRVRDMEENGIITFLEIIFDSTSFSDLLARLDFVSTIMQADERAYFDLVDARNETEAAQDALEETRESLAAEKELLEEREAELLEHLQEAEELIKSIDANLYTSRELEAQVQAAENQVLVDIRNLEAELERQRERERQERIRAQQAAAAAAQQGGGGGGGGSVVGTGSLVWPTSGRVSSEFGTRRHPVHGDMRFHGGIDIAAPHGTSVVAADSGTVIISRFNSSFGNYIVISHGNGINTLYAHLSTRSVSVGANVSRGQVIGRVGSTGVSTGPHLHFEVHVNGTRVNPRTHL